MLKELMDAVRDALAQYQLSDTELPDNFDDSMIRLQAVFKTCEDQQLLPRLDSILLQLVKASTNQAAIEQLLISTQPMGSGEQQRPGGLGKT
jgi:uncharacterized protein Yka (UPF0111/DUF47 family)